MGTVRDVTLRELAGLPLWNVDPSRIEVNADTARRLARVAFRFLQDCWRHEAWVPEHPVHIVEIGATQAMLAAGLLHHLRALVMRYPYSLPAFRYVLCSSRADQVASWAGRRDLHPWIEAGVLDFSVFDAAREEAVELYVQGGALHTENPVLLVAHRVFARLRQQAFRVRSGRIARLGVTEQPVETARGRLLLVDELPGAGTVPDEVQLALQVVARHVTEADVTVPVGALHALDVVGGLCNGRLVAVVSDDGTAELADLEGQRLEALDPWRNPGLPVSAAILREALNDRAASTFAEGLDGERFSAAIALGRPDDFVETLGAWRQELVESWSIEAPLPAEPDLSVLLERLRGAAWCPIELARLAGALCAAVPAASDVERRQLAAGLVEVRAQTVAEHHHYDVPYAAGRVWFALGRPELADEAWARSQERHGPSPGRLVNRALCAEMVGELDLAHDRLVDALALDPEDSVARACLERVVSTRLEVR